MISSVFTEVQKRFYIHNSICLNEYGAWIHANRQLTLLCCVLCIKYENIYEPHVMNEYTQR